jgi:hypothetical protein
MQMKHLYFARIGFTLVTLLLVTASLARVRATTVTKTYKRGGEGGWDYLSIDQASRHLYLSRSTHVVVIDADSGQAGRGYPGDSRSARDHSGPGVRTRFISNGREGTVSIFHLGLPLRPLNASPAVNSAG